LWLWPGSRGARKYYRGKKINLDNCNRGNNNMNMNNEADYVPCIMNKKILHNVHIDSKGINLSTRSNTVPISRNKDFLWEIWHKVYTHCKLKVTLRKVESEMKIVLEVVSGQAIVA
jgi:hypothetical protein